jgi:hypothetical protein
MIDLCGKDIVAYVSAFLCQWDVIQLTTVSQSLREDSAIPLTRLSLSIGDQKPERGVEGLLRRFPNLLHIRLKNINTVNLLIYLGSEVTIRQLPEPEFYLPTLRDILQIHIAGLRSIGIRYVDCHGLHAHMAFYEK